MTNRSPTMTELQLTWSRPSNALAYALGKKLRNGSFSVRRVVWGDDDGACRAETGRGDQASGDLLSETEASQGRSPAARKYVRVKTYERS